jgi:hypothetical protein
MIESEQGKLQCASVFPTLLFLPYLVISRQAGQGEIIGLGI